MSLQAEKTLVGQLVLDNNTYYVSNRDGITLDGKTYSNVVISYGSASYKAGQVSQPDKQGGGYEVGTFSVTLAFGERMRESGVNFDVTDVWNNSTAVFRRWTAGDDEWSDCEDFVSGIIKGFTIGEGEISVNIESWNPRDDFMLPAVVIEDQSGLTAAQAEGTIWGTAVDKTYILSADKAKFSYGELLRLTNNAGEEDYAYYVKLPEDSAGYMYFLSPVQGNYNFTNGGKVEKAFRNTPESAIGKTIPIQIGNLTDTVNGVFGKALCINEKIGQQVIIADTLSLVAMNNIGSWESGSKRYFVGKSIDEYVISASKNNARFIVDSTATLQSTITTTSSGVVEIITVDDSDKISWVNEDTSDVDNVPDLLSVCVIMIGSEAMLVIDQPYNNELHVERGYGGTIAALHSIGDKIYQSAKLAAKNLLSFTDKFIPKLVANQCYYDTPPYIVGATAFNDIVTSGVWSNILTSGNATPLVMLVDISAPIRLYQINVDLKFEKIEDSYTVYGLFAAIRMKIYSYDAGSIDLMIFNPSTTTTYNQYTAADKAKWSRILEDISAASGTHALLEIDSFTAIIRDAAYYNSNETYFKPSLNDAGRSVALDGTRFLISDLTNLNDKWKFHVGMIAGGIINPSAQLHLYNIGLWVDFFINFNKRILSSSIQARSISSSVTTICGDDSPTRVGDLMTNPVDVLAHILADELQYAESSDFTSRWSTVCDYFVDTGNFSDATAPTMAMSYGIDDDRKKGWEFCEWIASHFNLMLTRDYSGKIDIVNLHEIYYNTPSGTAIDIEEILFAVGSGTRRLSISQTGTDLIYNDFIVKWRRNNSTDEYQQVYHAPDNLTTHFSGNGLQSIREQYYGLQKRTLEIESPFIYAETEAIKKAQWEMDDKSEAHFYVQFFIDGDHWTEYGGKSEQYRLGDVIYFDGLACGIDFTATQTSKGGGKFYITEIIFHDDGNELEVHAKSIEPCTMFTADVEISTGMEIWNDTGGTAITGDSVKDDTGGTGVTGTDIKDDTGG